MILLLYLNLLIFSEESFGQTTVGPDGVPISEQIHLSLGKDDSEMVVSWVTKQLTELSTVEVVKIKDPSDIKKFGGIVNPFNSGTDSKRIIYLHIARIAGLEPGSGYRYRITCKKGSNIASSEWMPFKTFDHRASGVRIGFYGDLGVKGKKKDKAVGIGLLESLMNKKEIDAILHVGDIAYDMKDDNGKKGDKFLKMIQPIASRIPYQVIPGNHEQEEDLQYKQYNHRFNMIDSKTGDVNNHFYSFNIGLVHFIGINTQWHADDETDKMYRQFTWLQQDLLDANNNRESRPWIIVMTHQPLYCKKKSSEECEKFRQFKLMRKETHLEELFYRHGVDIVLSGHEHIFKRTFPVFRNTICASKHNESNPYDQPRGIIHVTSGVAGRLSNIKKSPFTARTFSENGVNIIHSISKKHLVIDFIRIDGKITDRIEIINKNLSGRRYSCKAGEKVKIKSY
jgi:UDP-2,3-diacylglucosamine pyrophosphatase LpxH